LVFALLALLGLVMSLLIPRRRVWVKLSDTGYQIGALARGDDPQLDRVVAELGKALDAKTASAIPETKPEAKSETTPDKKAKQ